MSNVGPVRSSRAKEPHSLRASAAVALAVGIGLFGAACGGNDQLSRGEYERELQDASAEIETSFEDVGSKLGGLGTGPTSLDEAANEIDAARERLREEADELEEVEPPEGAEEAHGNLVDGLRALAADLGDFQAAIDEGDVQRLRDFASDFDSLDSVETIDRAREELESQGYSLRRAE